MSEIGDRHKKLRKLGTRYTVKIPQRDTKPQLGVGTRTEVPEWQIHAEIRKLHRQSFNNNYEINEKDDEKGK